MKTPEVRHALSRTRHQFECKGDSKTHQAHKQACDIREIIRKYDNTGLLPDGRPPGSYVDITVLQKDKAQLIMENRSKLEKAAREIKTAEEQAVAAENDRIAKLEADSKRLAELEAQDNAASG